MWLIHETSINNLKEILEDGYVRSSKEQNYGHLKKVYMSVLFDDMEISGDFSPLLFFPISILDKYDVSHWSSTWFGEQFKKNKDDNKDYSVKYDKSKSAKDNVTDWHIIFRTLHNKAKNYKYGIHNSANEVLFNEKIPLSELAFIYLKKDHPVKFEIPKRVDTKQKLNKLLNK